MAHRLLCLVLFAAAGPALWHDAMAAPVTVTRANAALVAGPKGLMLRRIPIGVEASVLSTIDAQGRAKAAELDRRMRETQDPELREALGRAAALSKVETELQVLRFRATYARAHDDAASAEQFESELSMLLHPTFQAPVSHVVKAPMQAEKIGTKSVQSDVSMDAHAELGPGQFTTDEAQSSGATTTAAGNLDLTAILPGWSAPVVMRNDATATPGSCSPSATLDNTVSNSSLNWCWTQTGSGLPNYRINLFVDDVLVYGVFNYSGATAGNKFDINQGQISVRGGRHTVSAVGDYDNAIAETNESDNVSRAQYVWSPYDLSAGAPMVRPLAPPVQGPFIPLVNNDGFRFTRGASYAWVVSMAPRWFGDDYDLYVHDDYVGSTSGFSHYIQASGYVGYQTDFVVGHYSGTPTTLYPAAVRYSVSGGGGPYAMDAIDAQSRNGTPDANNVFAGQALPANRTADVYEAYLTSGTTWYFSLHKTSGSSNLWFEVFPGTAGVINSRGSGTTGSQLGDGQWVVLGPYTSTETGWHPVVVYRDNGETADQPLTYNLSWTTGGFVDAPDVRPSQALEFLGATPNPLAASGSFDFVLPSSSRATLALFDLGGRRVRSLADRVFGAGRQHVKWDGRDESGARLGAGVYWARFEAQGQSLSKAVVLVK